MARKSGEMPKVAIHAASQNARVRIGGKTHWLGKCAAGRVSKEQLARATRIWQEHLLGERNQAFLAAPPTPVEQPPSPMPEPSGVSVAAVGLKYLDFAEGYYRTADGGTTSSVDGIRMALKALFAFSDLPAASFGPKSLKQVQEMLVREGRPKDSPANGTSATITELMSGS